MPEAITAPPPETPPPTLPGASTDAPPGGAPPIAFVMPDKFKGKTAEDIAKSYVELERMKPIPANIENLDLDFDHVWKSSDIKPEAIAKEWKENGGKLKEETYVRLEAVKLKDKNGREVTIKPSRTLIDSLIGGQANTAELNARETATIVKAGNDAVGGDAQAKTIGDFLAQKDAAYLKTLQAQVNANPAFYPDAMRLMRIKYQELTGTAGSSAPITGDQSGSGTALGFASVSERNAEMAALKAKGIDWARDSAFMARAKASTAQIRRAI